MLIGFDASRAFTKENTGTENYSLNLLKALAKIDRRNHYRVYLRGISHLSNLSDLRYLESRPNFQLRPIAPNRLWTQLGLAIETWRAPVDVLFVPAHTLPILRRRKIGVSNFKFQILNSPKVVVTIHDLGVEYLPGYHQFPQRYYLDLASKYAAKHSDRLIAVSKSTKVDLVKRYGVSSDKISVVYEGVDRGFFKPRKKDEVLRIKKKYGIAGDYFLCVGTVQPRKNLLFVIDIFSTLVKIAGVKSIRSNYNNRYRKINLVIAGKMGWDFEDILQKKSQNVRFLKYISFKDLPALYSGAVATVTASLFEGFNLPILEALSSRCPVIASDIPVHRELFHAITRGYESIKKHKSSRKWSKSGKFEPMALAKLGNKRQWLRLLYQYYKYVDHNRSITPKALIPPKIFTWEKVAKETLAVFNNVVDA